MDVLTLVIVAWWAGFGALLLAAVLNERTGRWAGLEWPLLRLRRSVGIAVDVCAFGLAVAVLLD